MADEDKGQSRQATKQEPPRGFWWKTAWFFGIRRAPDRRLRVRFKKRFYFFAVLFFLFVGLGSLSAYSTSPSFCRSCHIMEPYYNNWASSIHGTKGVACVECHYPPGETSTILWKKFQAMSQVAKFVTRTYSSKPYAEVADESCLRSQCHAPTGVKPIPRETGVFTTENGIRFRFNHSHHLDAPRYGRQLRCVSCHSQLAISKNHIAVTYDTCYLCHLKGHKKGTVIEPLGGCSGPNGCHELPEREIKIGNIKYKHSDLVKDPSDNKLCSTCHQDAVQGEGKVEPERCLSCHNEPKKYERHNEVDFIHANHVTKHNTACFHCHLQIKHRPSPGPKKMGADCSACHEDLHDLQRSFYVGAGAKGVPDMPSPMYLANVDCSGCHKLQKRKSDISKGVTEMGTEKGCIDCHGKEYRGILDDVHTLMRETVRQLRDKLDALKAGLPPDWKTNPDFAQLVEDLNDAEYNIEFVGQAHAVHNVYYGAAILRATNEKLTEIAKSRRIQVDSLAKSPAMSGAFCATLCHARVGRNDVPPAKVIVRSREMPHSKHAEDMACTKCHDFGEHKKLPLKDKPGCGKCHEDLEDYPEKERRH